MTTTRALLVGIVTALAAAAPPALAAPSGSAVGPAWQEAPAADVTRGARAWSQVCERCHNLRSPSELEPADWDLAMTHMQVRANIPQRAADDIRAFLMSSASPPLFAETDQAAPASQAAGAEPRGQGDPVRGRSVYDATCVACHGADGRGVLPGMPALGGDYSAHAGSEEELIDHMVEGFQSDGSQIAMPPLGGNPSLTRKDMTDALAYIKQAFGGD